MIAIPLAVLAAAANACASVLQRVANLRQVEADRTGLAGLVGLLRSPLWLAGLGAVITGFLLQAGALAGGALAEVQPLMALDLPLSLLLASAVFRHRLSAGVWIDIGVMTAGIALFLVALHPTGGAPDHADGGDWILYAGVTGAVVALLTVAGSTASGTRRAALFGAASGISFALTAVFITAALADGLSWQTFTLWQTYMVAVAGLTAMVLLQEGLRAGSLVAVQPGVTLVDPVVAVALGALLFGEAVRTGPWVVPEIIGGAAVAWGAVRLSRAPVSRALQAQALAHEQARARARSSPSGAAPEDRRTARGGRC